MNSLVLVLNPTETNFAWGFDSDNVGNWQRQWPKWKIDIKHRTFIVAGGAPDKTASANWSWYSSSVRLDFHCSGKS